MTEREDQPRARGFLASVDRPEAYQPLRAKWDPTSTDGGGNRSRPPRTAKRRSRLGRFVATYRWRAYAIPVLAVLTGWVVYDAVRTVPTVVDDRSTDSVFGTLSHETNGTGVIGAPPKGDGEWALTLPTGVLPEGGTFTEQGAGTWHVVPGTTEQVGAGTETVYTYTVEIEDGIDTASWGGEEAFASMVDATLANPKSWTNDSRFAFRRVDTEEPDFRISLSSQLTTRQVCGFDIPIDASCNNQDLDRVVLDEPRWVRGAVPFDGDVGSYRQYMINHEVGHAIGYQQHQPCETDGSLAPIMMQQTFGTANNDIAHLDPQGVVPMDANVCRFNPWPFPRVGPAGVRDSG